MSRVMELEEQIKKLQVEKSKLFSEERKASIQDIKSKIALFELTAKELGFKASKDISASKSEKQGKTAGKKAKKSAKKSSKNSGMYFDLDGKKIPAGRGRPPKEVSVFAAEKGISVDSLKRNKDGSAISK